MTACMRFCTRSSMPSKVMAIVVMHWKGGLSVAGKHSHGPIRRRAQTFSKKDLFILTVVCGLQGVSPLRANHVRQEHKDLCHHGRPSGLRRAQHSSGHLSAVGDAAQPNPIGLWAPAVHSLTIPQVVQVCMMHGPALAAGPHLVMHFACGLVIC